jgi:hypothetical protein
MLGYLRQVAICKAVIETIRQSLVRSDDWHMKLKLSSIPATEGILRAVSALPDLGTEEKLRDFITAHVLDSLRLTAIQKEQLMSNHGLKGQESPGCCMSSLG